MEPDGEMTLAIIGQVLREVEGREGPIVAHRFCRHLDYLALTRLARRWVQDPADTANDPNRHLPQQHLLVVGMQGPEVRSLQRALSELGFPGEESGRFDEATLARYLRWLHSQGRISLEEQDTWKEAS